MAYGLIVLINRKSALLDESVSAHSAVFSRPEGIASDPVTRVNLLVLTTL